MHFLLFLCVCVGGGGGNDNTYNSVTRIPNVQLCREYARMAARLPSQSRTRNNSIDRGRILAKC